MTLAQRQDVAVRIGRLVGDLTAPEAALVDALLADAETMIMVRIPNLYDRLAEVALINMITMVEATAVARVMRNPDGVKQETIDDYTMVRDQALASGALYISSTEWAQILPDASAGRRGSLRAWIYEKPRSWA